MKTLFKIIVVIAAILLIAGGVLALGHFMGWWHFGNLIGDVRSYTYETATSLDVDVTLGEITVVQGEKLTVETNHKYVKCSVTGKTLEIKEDTANLPTSKELPYITITVPVGFEFENLSIKTTAGAIAGGSFKAKKMVFDLKGGVLGLDTVTASEKFTVNQLGGKIEIKNSVLTNADMDLTAGDCELDAILKGSNYLECGSGALKLTLNGDKDDYSITFKKVIGSTSLNGQSVETDKAYGDGKNFVRIDGGAGKIEVFNANA